MIQSWVINMDDIFVYYKCVDGHLHVKIIVAVAFVAVIIVGLMVLRIVKIVYIMKKNSSGVRTKLSC